MAQPLLRSCVLYSSKLTRLLRLERGRLTRYPTAVTPILSSFQMYSSERGGQPSKNKQKVVVLGIPNPFLWFRSRICYFLITAYFDKEFSINEFTEGAVQAFIHVSSLLSRCQFKALEGLVASDLVGKLEEKCALLSDGQREALLAHPDDIVHSSPGDVQIHYDDNGQKFVSVLMRFWYFTSARLPEDSLNRTGFFQVAFGGKGEAETKRLLTANYEFQREFTQGVPPAWIITKLEHSTLIL